MELIFLTFCAVFGAAFLWKFDQRKAQQRCEFLELTERLAREKAKEQRDYEYQLYLEQKAEAEKSLEKKRKSTLVHGEDGTPYDLDKLEPGGGR